MKRYLWFIIFSFLTLSSIAQVFKGKIANEKGEPVPYASLYLKELRWGFTTDDNHWDTQDRVFLYRCLPED